MDYFVVVCVFPLLLWMLSLGNGLLIERLAGIRVPALLLLPVGFGALIVASQLMTRASVTAPLTPWLLLALALIGFLLARRELVERWRARRRGRWWGVIAMAAGYAAVNGPVIAAGRLTFPGYLIDTTGAIQLTGAEWLLHHGNNFASSVPGFGTTLANYFGSGYPSGGHTVLSAVGWLSGQDLLWLYSPFQAVELSLAALVLTFLGERAGLSRRSAAIAGFTAAVPALVFSYALMGSIKELTALPMLLLMGALLVLACERRRTLGLRAVLPFAVAAAAALGAIGVAAAPWVILFGIALLLGTVPILQKRDLRRLLLAGSTLTATTALLALPTVGSLSKTLALAENVSSSNPRAAQDPGNLLQPLKFVQTFGVWIGESHRVDPKEVTLTYVLIGVVIVCLMLGLVWLVRRRAWSIVGFIVISILVWVILTQRGTEWTDAKLLVLLSPVMMFGALVGAQARLGSRGLENTLLTVVVVGSVLASDALAYHATNMAPTQRYAELRSIGLRFAGQGPTLASDFDEYALYLLRNMRVDSPGLAYPGPFKLADGEGTAYGHSYDIDAINGASLRRFRFIVMRRSPERSRPPSNYTRVWLGLYYTVWRRTSAPPISHLGLGTPDFQPSSVAPCSTLGGLAREAVRNRGRIAFAARPQNVVAELATAVHSPSIVQIADLENRRELGFNGPGRIKTAVRVSVGGQYELWLAGDVDRPLHVVVDGRLVGARSAQSGDDGNVIYVTALWLKAGDHPIELVRYGGGVQPGNNAGTLIDGIVLEPIAAEHEVVQAVSPRTWRSLCGRPLDWVEVLSAR